MTDQCRPDVLSFESFPRLPKGPDSALAFATRIEADVFQDLVDLYNRLASAPDDGGGDGRHFMAVALPGQRGHQGEGCPAEPLRTDTIRLTRPAQEAQGEKRQVLAPASERRHVH